MKERHIIPGTPEWHARRREGVGGSDIPALCGVSPWATYEDVWRDKRGVAREGASGDGEVRKASLMAAAARGTFMEPHVVQRSAEELGVGIRPGNEFVRHPRWDEGVAIQGNSDGHLTWQGSETIFEAKTTAVGSYASRFYLGGRPSVDHWLQCHTYFSVFPKAEYAIIGCVVGPSDPSVWTPSCGTLRLIGFAPDRGAQAMIEKVVSKFWPTVRGDGACPEIPRDSFRRLARSLRGAWQRAHYEVL